MSCSASFRNENVAARMAVLAADTDLDEITIPGAVFSEWEFRLMTLERTL